MTLYQDVAGGADTNKASSQAETSAAAQEDDGEGIYSLVGVVSHLGRSADHGHYVCHLKKDGVWVIYNDDKVRSTTLHTSLSTFQPIFLQLLLKIISIHMF